MKYLLPLCLVCLFWTNNLSFTYTQTCIPGMLILSSQSDIDNFSNDYPGCTEILGDLRITAGENLNGLSQIEQINGKLEIYSTSLDDLFGLSNLTSVGKDLNIENTQITNFQGMENLTSVGGLVIKFNTKLKNFQGLNNLSAINGWLELSNCGVINNFTGLENVTSISAGVSIRNNGLLTLNGLNNLQSIGAILGIDDNFALSSLSALSQLTSLGGGLSIKRNNVLSNLEGLEGIEVVPGGLEIIDNPDLTALTGLNNIASVGDYFIVKLSPLLTSLDGMESLMSIEGYCTISTLPALTTVEGLRKLQTVGESMTLSSLPQLQSLQGLNQFKSTGGQFRVVATGLLNMVGLDQLESVGSGMYISNNNVLESLTGMESLTTVLNGPVSNIMSIVDNDNLVSLSGLRNVDVTGIGLIHIRYNNILDACNLPFLCDWAFHPGFDVWSNGPNCSDEDELKILCQEFTAAVKFKMFYDINDNGLHDSEEPPITFGSAWLDPSGKVIYTNHEGKGFTFLENGMYSLIFNQGAMPLWSLTTDDFFYEFEVVNNEGPDELFLFGVKPLIEKSEMVSAVSTELPRCNTWINVDVSARNIGTSKTSGTLWLELDEEISEWEFRQMPDVTSGSHRFGWHFNDLYPGILFNQTLEVRMPGPPDFPVGDQVYFTTSLDYNDNNGAHTADDFIYPTEVLCSFDPNDKLVNPQRAGDLALFAEDLIFTVRFQNTGNAEAYDVVIRDTLDANLDVSTFRVISTSHPDILETNLEDDQFLTFSFPYIYLPDSTTDFDGSQGYVTYLINPKEDLEEMTTITNTASIYFDFNPPVVTNTTKSILVSELPTSTQDLSTEANRIKVFPNPTRDEVQVFGEGLNNVWLSIIDSQGRKVFSEKLNEDGRINLENYAKGLYLLRFQIDDQIVTRRIVKI